MIRSWWQKIKQHPVITISVMVAIVVGIALIAIECIFNGTGFAGKMLWDWLQLLIIPIMLAIGGFWLNQVQKEREDKATEERTKIERETAKERDKTERAIAEDNQHEVALQAYIDKMSELLLTNGLRNSKPEDEVRKIARVRTLTVLPRLDETRKGSILQFLYESGLIGKANCIVDLKGADLSGAELSRTNLHGVDLEGTNLFEANLEKADLSGANLSRAVLEYAQLSEAVLSEAVLSEAALYGAVLYGANLYGANLSVAYLEGANLLEANLLGANLSNAKGVTTEQLEKAKSLKGATMPDGSKHP